MLMNRQPLKKETYFFCGIGGSGMSSLAQVLAAKGHKIYGSDRIYDTTPELEKFTILQNLGIKMFPQDGSGVEGADFLIVSSAIEDSIPDIATAKSHNIPIKKRAELLAEFFNGFNKGIAIGGTSGKSTTVAMLSHILCFAKKDPTTINGAAMANAIRGKQSLGNVVVGKSDICIIEADESDGSIEYYKPAVSVLTNISEDHKTMAELRPLFKTFVDKAKMGNVIGMDCFEAAKLASPPPKTRTFTTDSKTRADIIAKDIKHSTHGVTFGVGAKQITMHVQGKHNVANACAAIATASFIGVSLNDSAAALQTFNGVKRRLETIGKVKGVTIIDDFAHNPEKIKATLEALHEQTGKVWVIYQPHGYGPTSFMKDNLVKAFSETLKDGDDLIMPEIFYAGGTAEKTISSHNIVEQVRANNKRASFFENRADIIPYLVPNLKYGDRVVVMGARDDTLTDFAKDILDKIALG